MSDRLRRLKEEFDREVERFGSPELNMRERRRMLKQLRDMEQELDQYYKLGEQ